nr:MAG TPA: hypothetical protein [Caudoviricetes sp.]
MFLTVKERLSSNHVSSDIGTNACFSLLTLITNEFLIKAQRYGK